jgi:hypothetical protein
MITPEAVSPEKLKATHPPVNGFPVYDIGLVNK